MKKVLITGAAGFIGSHLCDKFIKNDYYVIGVDNFITGRPKNIMHLENEPNFDFIELDVTNHLEIESDLDYVLHFACPASPVDYMRFPLETMKVDSIGTLNTLEIAKEKDAHYIFASTSEVYGDPAVNPQNEEYWGNVNPVGPRSVYDEAKRFSEALTMSYFREYGVDTRIVRIFNTYGPRMNPNDGRVVPNFISQAIKGHNITVYGDGSQSRSFCFISDLIEGIFRILNKKDINGEIVNLGNPDEYKIFDFAKIITQLTNSNSEIIFKDLPEDDPKQRCPNIRKAQKLIDWTPTVSLEEGIHKTIDYFIQEISQTD